MVPSYAKTEAGQSVIKTRSVVLSPRQRTLLLLCDGRRDASQLLQETAGLGVTAPDLQDLLDRGLVQAGVDVSISANASSHPMPVAPLPQPSEPVPGSTAASVGPEQTSAERYCLAYPIATRLTAALGLRGMRLQLEVERCSSMDDLKTLFPRLLDAAASHSKAKQDLQPLRVALGMQ